jgi:hypothetical protein
MHDNSSKNPLNLIPHLHPHIFTLLGPTARLALEKREIMLMKKQKHFLKKHPRRKDSSSKPLMHAQLKEIRIKDSGFFNRLPRNIPRKNVFTITLEVIMKGKICSIAH